MLFMFMFFMRLVSSALHIRPAFARCKTLRYISS